MREIKFKVWDIRSKRFEDLDSHKFGVRLSNSGFDPSTGWNSYDEPTWDRSKHDSEEYIYLQFTGLKDKNGKEIYEGDIWKRDTFIGQIVFKYCAWHVERVPASGCYQFPAFYSNMNTGEVIGNIYENPEFSEAASCGQGSAMQDAVEQNGHIA